MAGKTLRSMRTPMARVRGLGAAKEGVHHWWTQRLTAIALVPLTLWFVVSVAGMAGMDHAAAAAWIGSPPVTVLLVLLIAATLWHAQLGVQHLLVEFAMPVVELPEFRVALHQRVELLLRLPFKHRNDLLQKRERPGRWGPGRGGLRQRSGRFRGRRLHTTRPLPFGRRRNRRGRGLLSSAWLGYPGASRHPGFEPTPPKTGVQASGQTVDRKRKSPRRAGARPALRQGLWIQLLSEC